MSRRDKTPASIMNKVDNTALVLNDPSKMVHRSTKALLTVKKA